MKTNEVAILVLTIVLMVLAMLPYVRKAMSSDESYDQPIPMVQTWSGPVRKATDNYTDYGNLMLKVDFSEGVGGGVYTDNLGRVYIIQGNVTRDGNNVLFQGITPEYDANGMVVNYWEGIVEDEFVNLFDSDRTLIAQLTTTNI